MQSEQFRTRIAEILEIDPELATEDFQIGPDRWDSLAHLSTIALIDEVYGVSVPTNDLIECKSVGDVLKLVRDCL